MKKLLTISTIILLAVIASPTAYSQNKDTEKAKYSKEKDLDNEDDEDELPTEKVERKKKEKAPIPPARIGIEGGICESYLRFGENESDFATGVRLGGIVDIPLSANIFFTPGLSLITNGGSAITYVNGSTGRKEYSEHTWRIYTLAIPLQIQYKFGQPNDGRFFIGGGVTVGYNIRGAINPPSIKGESLKIGSSKTDDIKPLDVSAGIRGGYELENGLFFCVRSEIGFSNLRPQSLVEYPFISKIYSNSFALQIGYVFGKSLKHKHRPSKDDNYLERKM
jgi:hypothetical protein